MSDFFYPIERDGNAQHLELTGLGIEVHDFNRKNTTTGQPVHRLDYHIDTVTAKSGHHLDTFSPPAVLRDNDADFALSGTGRYFAPDSKVMARGLIGKDLRDLYEYVYAVDEVRQGTGESLVGPAMRAVEEAEELGFGLAVVPERIRLLARQGYEGWIAQARDSASNGDVASAYVELEQGTRGLALLDIAVDMSQTIAALDADLATSAKFRPVHKKWLLAESARLASALTSVEQQPMVADSNDGVHVTATKISGSH